MKIFKLSTSQPRSPHLWQVAGLKHSTGMSLLGQIREGLDGRVAQLIIDWAKISQADLCKMFGIPPKAFSRSLRTRFSATH